MTYQPLVRRTSGGDQLEIASGGVLELESGATLSLTGQAITTTGTVTGNNIVLSAVAAASSGSTGFSSYGITQVWSCGVSTGTVFTMPGAAAAGTEKWIACIASTSTAPAVVSLADTLISGYDTITFSSGSVTAPQWIHLLAQNTTNWFVLGMSTGATAIS